MPLNPASLSLEDAARVLSASGKQPITVDMLRRDLADGAPANPDGTLNLIHFTAWLAKEVGYGD